MNDVMVFEHEKFGIFRVLTAMESPRFSLADISRILEFDNITKTIWLINPYDLFKVSIQSDNETQDEYFTNGKGLSDLIFKSRSPIASSFLNWVEQKVLPSVEHQYFLKEFLNRLSRASETAPKTLCCVYVLELENHTVKIGYTKNFSTRMAQVSTASGLKVINWCHSEYVLQEDARKIERLCHKTFHDSRKLGEFFQISFEDARNELERHLKITETMNLNE